LGLLPAANEFEPTLLFAGIGMLGHRAPPLPRSYHPLQGVFGGRIRQLPLRRHRKPPPNLMAHTREEPFNSNS
jgi:hypothetical protein